MKMYDLHKKNEDYARQIQEMKQKNIDLTEELRMLNDDPMYLEKVAREKMGLTKEGEVIYKIMPQNWLTFLLDNKEKFDKHLLVHYNLDFNWTLSVSRREIERLSGSETCSTQPELSSWRGGAAR